MFDHERIRKWEIRLIGLLSGIIAIAIITPVAVPRAEVSIAQAPSDPSRAELRGYIENVTQATARRYGATDSAGRKMDTAKIIQDPNGGYLAVYHTFITGVPHVSIATSSDLINWTFQRDLGSQASQPYIAALNNGGFVVAWEQEPNNHLAFRYYSNRTNLLTGVVARSFDAPRNLSACAEGTPNIYSVLLSPNIDNSVIDIGAHYFWNCDRDRQQRGTLRNFNSWSTSAQPNFDNAILHWGVGGNIGDRDALWFNGFQFGVIEGQFTKGDFGSWRSFIHDYQTGNAEILNIQTNGGSSAFANPTATNLVAPNGQSAIAVTLFIPSEGAAPGEAGELIYYRTYSPIITYEAEQLRVVATSGDLHRVALDTGYSGGQGTILEANAAGDFVTYTVNVPAARTYNIRVRIKRMANRGIWQFSSNGVNHGSPVDGFSTTATFPEINLGNVAFSTAGNKSFRFQVIGRNPSSTGFWIALDYIRLIPQ